MISNQVYKFFADYVYQHTGILYKEHDYYRLDSRINTMIKHFGVEDADALYQMLAMEIDKATHEFLVDLFTNNETYFMRDLKPFKAFAKGLIPIVKQNLDVLGNINIWSCASSTGQEIYSIQMALDSFGAPGDFDKLKLHATDISQDALKKAKSGNYLLLEVQRGLPAPFLVKYFTANQEDGSWDVKDELKKRVTFSQFNLLKDVYPVAKYDIIFCRNVLIYQDMENKRKILENIYGALRPGGFLVFGAGESMIGINLPFKHVEIEGSWFYQKE